MNAEPTIKCPQCGAEIKLTESLAAPLIEAKTRDFEDRLKRKEEDVAGRETLLREKEKSLSEEKKLIDSRVQEGITKERTKIAEEETSKAKQKLALDLDQKDKEIIDLKESLEQYGQKLTEAQQAQVELLRKQRELDDAKRELNLTVEKRIQEGLVTVRDQARKESDEQFRLKVQEKEEVISSMQKKIEELSRKAEQGSQQLQGEVLELELEALLRAKFPMDTLEPVPKGEHGGDLIQRVVGPMGQVCGTILWESKRTKNWSDGWLAKLRDDQRAARADISVIVTQVLPKGVETFDCIDGVWVAHFRAILPVASVMRSLLADVALARQASEGQHTKMGMVYEYLTGPRFKQRVEAIVEAFSSMQEDLDREKKAIMKQWAKREEQIDRVMQGTVGMYGDLQGIAGKTLQEIDGLELRVLEAPHDEM